MTQRLAGYFKDYASYHRTPGNQVCHYLGIPMILVTTLGLLAQIGFSGDASALLRLDGGLILTVVAIAWYFWLDWRIAIPFTFVGFASYFAGRAIPLPTLWAVFLLGWVIQFIGHLGYEKKSPAFFKNLEHLLVGPLWVFAKAVGYRK